MQKVDRVGTSIFLRVIFIFTLCFFIGPSLTNAAALSRGAVLGALTDTSVKVWARTDSAGTFKVEYKTSAGSYPGTFTSNVNTVSGNDFTNVVNITGLTADTAYDYRIYVDDVLSAVDGFSGSFTTMKTQGTACSYRFSLTGDIDYLQAPFSLFTTITSSYAPLFSIFPGDQIYAPTSGTQADIESYYKDNWGVATLRDFLKNIPSFFIWDDHEFFSPPSGQSHNWDGGKSDSYSSARQAYEEYQNSVNPSPKITGETYYNFNVCDTGFFVADSRSFRSPSYATDSGNNEMFGSAQVEHMKSWLLNDSSRVKFLISPSPWPDNVANGKDSYFGYNNERQELYSFIKKNNIRNVFILSGDQHNQVLYKTDLSNTNKLYEFSATPIASGIQTTNGSLPSGGSTKVCINSAQSKHFGIIDVDTTASPAQVNFKAYNSSNSNVCDQVVTLDDVGPSVPTVVSAANQTFNVSDASTTMSTMTITDASTAVITAANDIRIRIPSDSNMIWDTSITSATIGGAASAKVTGAGITYENSSKTAVVNVTTNFANGDVVTIAGLKFKTFSAPNAKTNLTVDFTNDDGGDSTDTSTIEILPTSGSAIYTAKNHAYRSGQSTQAINTITILDGSTPAITSANDIRIKIPAGFNMSWDATDTTATIGGTASGKVSATVSYEDSNKTLVIDVTSNFIAGDYITVSDLSFTTFSGTSTVDNLELDNNNDGTGDVVDPKSIKGVSSTTKVWTALGGDSLWSNANNWSGQAVPIAGDAVVFDSTSTSDCIVDYSNTGLASITLDATYTGTVRYTPYANGGTLGALTLTGALTVDGGVLIFEGDSHVDGDVSTAGVNDGTGYIITASSVVVGAGGIINSDGEGFEQGVGPGHGGVTSGGGGTGGSYGGVGGYPNSFNFTPSSPYGSFASPLSLGSGGGYDESIANVTASSGAGGAGGGALKFAVSSGMTVNGTVSVNGENASIGTGLTARYGAGSGGSIWISGGTLTGSGNIFAKGGITSGTVSEASHPGGTGGGGRISLQPSTYSFTGTLAVDGGAVPTTYATTGTSGRAGTISFPASKMSNFTLTNTLTLGADGTYAFGDLTISSGGTLIFDSNPVAGTGATISATNITISSGGTLSVDGKGYHSGNVIASGVGGLGNSTSRAAGGGYGGVGGDSAASYAAKGGSKYGSVASPVSLGSGGGRTSSDGAGGGALKINLTGTLTVDGTLTAGGNAAGANALERGAGSGGSLWINGGTLAGTGTIKANGGAGSSGGGAGGGGRISLGVTSTTFSGLYQVSSGARGSASHQGHSGTISFPANTDLTVAGAMTLGSDTAYSFQSVTINNGGSLTLDIDPTTNSNNGSGTTLTTANLTINSGGTLTATGMGHVDTTGASASKGATGTTNRVGGGGHGGAGGAGSSTYGTPAGGATNDSSSNPVYPGSSCSSSTTCAVARAGGAMTINVKNNFVHNGTVSANATTNTPSAGGSLNFTVKNWSGTTGTMTATGGSVTTGSGGGGGGLIKIDYVNKTYSGTAPSAVGGTSTGGTPGTDGSAGVVTQNAVSDSTAPTISSVSSSGISDTTATITWTTDEASSSIVDYGATDSYGTSTSEADTSPRVLSHSVNLSGLTSGTLYHFRVRSIDDAGSPNTGTSGDYTFTTTGSAPDVTAPVISNIVSDPTHNSVTITWDTDEASSSIVEYGPTASYGTTTTEADTSPRVTSHSVVISSLDPSSTYHFRVKSNDASSNLQTSSDQTFDTDATPDVTAPVISNVSSTPLGTSVTITWDTDEASSSIIDYGTTDSYGTTTSEADTSPRVTSHSVNITGLTSETLYHFRVNSNDASSNLATGSDNTFTTTDITAPVISNVSTNESETSVIITWDTNEASSSFVDYGTTNSYGTTTAEIDTSPRVISHSVTITGLSAETTYHFRLNSTDASSNTGQTADDTFTTDATPVVVSTPSSGGGTAGVAYIAPPTNILPITPVVPIKPIVPLPDNNQTNTETNTNNNSEIKNSFIQNFKTGDISEEIKNLQKWLNNNGFLVANSGAGSSGKETSLFGKLTREAVIKFQLKYDIKPPAGYFGPLTRAKLNSLIEKTENTNDEQIENKNDSETEPQVDSQNTEKPNNQNFSFTRELQTGDTGEDVLILQKILNKNGFHISEDGPGSVGNETNKFGRLTRGAVSSFQLKYDINPPVGYFGPKTRTILNNLIQIGEFIYPN